MEAKDIKPIIELMTDATRKLTRIADEAKRGTWIALYHRKENIFQPAAWGDATLRIFQTEDEAHSYQPEFDKEGYLYCHVMNIEDTPDYILNPSYHQDWIESTRET